MMFPKPEIQKKKGKAKIWADVRQKELIPKFNRWGIYSCEIGLYGCLGRLFLGFAHTKKRGYIRSGKDLRRVVLACQNCHDIVEYQCKRYTGVNMQVFLESIIKKRETRLRSQGLL